MKRTYEKPTMEVERFAPNQTIANCVSATVTNYTANFPASVTCLLGGQVEYVGNCKVKDCGTMAYIYWKNTSVIGNYAPSEEEKQALISVVGTDEPGWHYAVVNYDSSSDTIYTGNSASSV